MLGIQCNQLPVFLPLQWSTSKSLERFVVMDNYGPDTCSHSYSPHKPESGHKRRPKKALGIVYITQIMPYKMICSVLRVPHHSATVNKQWPWIKNTVTLYNQILIWESLLPLCFSDPLCGFLCDMLFHVTWQSQSRTGKWANIQKPPHRPSLIWENPSGIPMMSLEYSRTVMCPRAEFTSVSFDGVHLYWGLFMDS